jgi:hypothetical protein
MHLIGGMVFALTGGFLAGHGFQGLGELVPIMLTVVGIYGAIAVAEVSRYLASTREERTHHGVKHGAI